MKCPVCGAITQVLSTRKGTLRRRKCEGKEPHLFSTEEVTEGEIKSYRHKAFLLLELGRLLRKM